MIAARVVVNKDVSGAGPGGWLPAVATQRIAQRSGFDFCRHLGGLCEQIVSGLPELGHVQLDRVAICFAQTRTAALHGVQATLTPLRFAGGAETTDRGNRSWGIQRVLDASGQEMLYVLRFYLPRFLDQSLTEKLITVVHELWHISPKCDGDLRRHAGRCFAHSHSKAHYDAQMHELVNRWLATNPPADAYAFLENNSRQLAGQYGGVYGLRIPAPKLHPIERPAPPIRLPKVA